MQYNCATVIYGGKTVENIYKKLYFRLFNAMTKALEELGHGNNNGAKKILEQAQIQAEELFISTGTNNCV